MKLIYEGLVAKPNEPYDIISKKWLTDWLSARFSDQIMPVDNKELLCIHSKLNYKAFASFKCISKSGADQIYAKYGGGPRLLSDSLCQTCVAKQVDVLKITSKVEEDSKFVSSQLKFTLSPNEDSFWIGKESLRCWKKIKIKSYENNYLEESG